MMAKIEKKTGRAVPLTPEEVEDACFLARDKAWVAVADIFDQNNEAGTVTYQSLADRVGRKKAQVHRWIDSSCNMTLRSLGLLAAGLNADVVIKLEPKSRSHLGVNHCHPSEDAAAVVLLRMKSRQSHVIPSSYSSESELGRPHQRFSMQIEENA